MTTEHDLQKIKQWMEVVNEFFESIEKNSIYSNGPIGLPREAAKKIRLLRAITNSLSIEVSKVQVPYLYTCHQCQKGFDKYSENLEDYHKVDYSYHCPHCGSSDFGKTSGLEPMLSINNQE